MEFDEIPDDVWSSIFECVDEPAQLAVLMLTCQRFRALASRLLLRDIRWTQAYSTRRNLEAWKGGYRGMEVLPRKLTLGVPFELGSYGDGDNWYDSVPELQFYDMIHSRIPSFTGLVELVLDGTEISPYTYSVLAALPALRSLSVLNCTFSRLQAPGSVPNLPLHYYLHHYQEQAAPIFPFSTLPLTHLSLHNPKPSVPPHLSGDNGTSHHPIHLITASSLTSLSITWTGSLAAIYARRHWPLPALRELEVIMPTLTRDLVDSLVNFVHACSLGPRISLCIQNHELSDQQISSVQIPLVGVWRYEGPLGLQVESFCSPLPTPASASAPAASASAAILTTVIMTEPLRLTTLLASLEKLPRSLETLDVQVSKWDIELLFAIRQLFPGIRELVVRYGRGVLPADFFVSLGSNILYNLPQLHTLKLIADDDSTRNGRNRPGQNWGGGVGGHANANNNNNQAGLALGLVPPGMVPNHLILPHQHQHPALPLPLSAFGLNSASASHSGDEDFSPFPPFSSASGSSSSSSNQKLEHGDLKDYLVGWNRYCRSLRRVQLDRRVWWGRRWEGDGWVVGRD
ncbi:hypothetical protein GALMADRAFT_259983 [Galerina marginata CBS 339.88]|uniref:F-box domain-containing protein n=1 Tax=Galerina marginata (strain CBS 339.88) TaxID=685588 RepID=A0A067SGR4_GALM3|nr:hypothetical protein GALMADRAFT_259983 [Galerina marginata CBS 339.88]